MGLEAIVAMAVIVGTAGGSWFSGRKAGLGGALTAASDVVGMLAVQVGELRSQVAMKELEIERLTRERDALEADHSGCYGEGEGKSP